MAIQLAEEREKLPGILYLQYLHCIAHFIFQQPFDLNIILTQHTLNPRLRESKDLAKMPQLGLAQEILVTL